MNAPVRVKFCGVTRPGDARVAADLGVDAIGLVMTRRSRRFVTTGAARAIRDVLPPFVTTVALFMDDAPAWIDEVISQVGPDLLQFHGAEDAAFCEQFDRRYVKALPMADGDDVDAMLRRHPRASGLLLDSHAAGGSGGSGERFDWRRVPRDAGRPLIVAGGLDAGNVGTAIRTARPYGVDVSSGIESAPGIKDVEKMRRFIDAATRASRE
jgi:phosphoribosylanthranilate isomerase